ncbi:glycosyltransferase [Coraliomargarita sp. SDUM461004]|uniref:Glycosyltransferase n=1 Tax=Thalassobacterium sedimentorum TaxID=3041258 RepID=A0ABU1ALH2_9BACT|nr:glycosyltransferase [Coraliomargarita sp. SDUM461004]MDQ8195584.1 glycosyltransferase [Coraliomargarita sp. SDUM461004]
MKVWLVNIFDAMAGHGGQCGRMVSIAHAFADADCAVTWWTSDWDHGRKCRREASEFSGHPWQTQVLPSLSYQKNISLRRFYSHARFARDWKRKVRAELASGSLAVPDLVVVNLPPPSLAAAVAEMKAELGFTLICDVRDAWPENFSQILPFSPEWNRRVGGCLFRPLAAAARRAYAAADGLSAVSQDYLDVVSSYRAHEGRVFYIGCPPERLLELPIAMDTRCAEGTLKLVYIGSLSASYDLATLIEALREEVLRSLPIELHFAGYGALAGQLQAWAQDAGLTEQVHFHGMLDWGALRALLNQCHLAINAVQPESRIAMPNKVGDYFAAALPVLHTSAQGELAQLLSTHDMGASYQAGQSASLAHVILGYAKDRPRLLRQSVNARAFAEAQLDRREIYPKFVKWALERGEARSLKGAV